MKVVLITLISLLTHTGIHAQRPKAFPQELIAKFKSDNISKITFVHESQGCFHHYYCALTYIKSGEYYKSTKYLSTHHKIHFKYAPTQFYRAKLDKFIYSLLNVQKDSLTYTDLKLKKRHYNKFLKKVESWERQSKKIRNYYGEYGVYKLPCSTKDFSFYKNALDTIQTLDGVTLLNGLTHFIFHGSTTSSWATIIIHFMDGTCFKLENTDGMDGGTYLYSRWSVVYNEQQFCLDSIGIYKSLRKLIGSGFFTEKKLLKKEYAIYKIMTYLYEMQFCPSLFEYFEISN